MSARRANSEPRTGRDAAWPSPESQSRSLGRKEITRSKSWVPKALRHRLRDLVCASEAGTFHGDVVAALDEPYDRLRTALATQQTLIEEGPLAPSIGLELWQAVRHRDENEGMSIEHDEDGDEI